MGFRLLHLAAFTFYLLLQNPHPLDGEVFHPVLWEVVSEVTVVILYTARKLKLCDLLLEEKVLICNGGLYIFVRPLSFPLF